MRDFTKLIVWQRANALAVDVYGVAGRRDFKRVPGLSSQLIRASASIAFNIAEGTAHRSRLMYARFLSDALGSSSEVESQLHYARGIRVVRDDEADRMIDDVRTIRKMLTVLRDRVLGEDGGTSAA